MQPGLSLPRTLVALALVGASACATGGDDGGSGADGGTTGTSMSTTASTTVTTSESVSTTATTATTADDGDGSSSSAPASDLPPECPEGMLDCPCDAEGACVRPLQCIDDVCSEPIVCDADANEPNDFRDEATALGSISDDDLETLEFAGVLDGPDDADWFTYTGSDNLGDTVDPARTLTVPSGTLQMCKFFQCNVGEAQVVCPAGTEGVTEGLLHGCCAPTAFAFDSDGVECIGGAFDTGGTVWIVLRAATEACVAYSGVAHF
ncbi:MAG: hypothetical protein K1X88_05325 [Nannocystaceae bacterium]|nr:hypothetical protein [Nannocystaceae bacterium]